MTNTGLINSFNEVNSFLIFLRNEYATAAEAGNLSSGDLTAAVQLNAQASADAEDAAKDLLEREFEKIQEEVNIDKEILGALPKNGIRANSKYAQRVEEVAAKYYVYKDKLYDEAKRRYNELYTAKYNISVDTFYDFCIKVAEVNFKDYLFGDEKKNVVQLAISPIFNQMLIYLKNRVEADIYNKSIDSKLNDFSNPKFFMISAHDSTIWGLEIFQKSYEYIRPTFASSVFIEVYRINENATSYNDYEVHYIVNDKSIDIYNLSDFLNVTENKVWKYQQILDFCKVKIGNNTGYAKTVWIVVLSILVFTLIVAIIIISIKLCKKSKLNFKLAEE